MSRERRIKRHLPPRPLPAGPEGDDATPADPICPACRKPLTLCVCAAIDPVATRHEILILQHPQEQDRELGTAAIAHRQLARSKLVVGLSWRSLASVLGRPVDPRRWGVLYLGPVKASGERPPLAALSQRGLVLPDQAAVLGALDGIVVLDGNWSQAKALWWRNPWVLKARRVVLGPRLPSRYGKLRREPRRDGLSTLEAAALLLGRLEAKPELAPMLAASFERLLVRYRALALAAGSAGGDALGSRAGNVRRTNGGRRWRRTAR